MKCPVCSNEFQNENNVCPYCNGSAFVNPNQNPVNEQAYTARVAVPYAPQTESAANEEPRKKKKKIAIIIIALVLTVALIVCGVIFVPKIIESIKGSKNPADANEDTAKVGEMFSSAMNEVSDEGTKSAINVVSSAFNSLFTTKSFSMDLEMVTGSSGYTDEYGNYHSKTHTSDFEFDVVFGKDLASSQLLFDSDYMDIGFYEGRFYYVEDNDYGIRLNIADIAAESDELLIGSCDELIAARERTIEHYEQMIYNCPADSVSHYENLIEQEKKFIEIIKNAQDEANALGQTALSIIKDERLNISAVDELMAATVLKWKDDLGGESGIVSSMMGYSSAFVNMLISLESTENVLSLFTDFLVSTDGKGVFEVETETKDKATEYEISFNYFDIMVAMIEWVLSSEEAMSVYNNDENVKASLERELSYYKEKAQSSEKLYTVKATVVDSYLTSAAFIEEGEEYFSFVLENVNSVEIDEEDFHDIRDSYNACDYKYSFDDAEDLLDGLGGGSSEAVVTGYYDYPYYEATMEATTIYFDEFYY